MNHAQRQSIGFPNFAFNFVIRRPLSTLTALAACLVILTFLYLRLTGNMYVQRLNYIDAFTPVMVSILLLRGVVSLRRDSDLQAISISLIGALSFIFIYEAIYKLSFYGFPWRMGPTELREFIIQVGTALTALAGFAFGKFRLSKPSLIFLSIFAAAYIFWLLVGFPQVDNGQNYYLALIHIPFTWNMIYAINRGTKVMVFLAYFFFYASPVPMARKAQPDHNA